VTVVAGFALALAAVWILAAILPALAPTLVLVVRARDAVQALGVAAAVMLGAATFPVVRVAHIDPASVFRR
jgi:ABC-type lipoprotein release transport system permease subunit